MMWVPQHIFTHNIFLWRTGQNYTRIIFKYFSITSSLEMFQGYRDLLSVFLRVIDGVYLLRVSSNIEKYYLYFSIKTYVLGTH